MKKAFKRSAAMLMAAATLIGICSCSVNPPTEKQVESIVKERIPEPAHCVSVEKREDGIYYQFQSDERELYFDVVAYENTAAVKGYWEQVRYAEAVREYYSNGIMSYVEACSCYSDNPHANLGTDIIFYVDSKEDAWEVALVLGKCNKIVSDQLRFTPDEDLTRSIIMDYRFQIIPAKLKDKRFSNLEQYDYVYSLNGYDTEDDVFAIIKEMIPNNWR